MRANLLQQRQASAQMKQDYKQQENKQQQQENKHKEQLEALNGKDNIRK